MKFLAVFVFATSLFLNCDGQKPEPSSSDVGADVEAVDIGSADVQPDVKVDAGDAGGSKE